MGFFYALWGIFLFLVCTEPKPPLDYDLNRKTIPVILEVFADTISEWNKIISEIRFCIKWKKPINDKLIHRLCELFIIKEQKDDLVKHKTIEKYRDLVLEKFKHSRYQFILRKRIKVQVDHFNKIKEINYPSHLEFEFTFEYMILYGINAVYDEKKKGILLKEDCIIVSYTAMEKYMIDGYGKRWRAKTKYTESRMKMISVYIAFIFGLVPTLEGNPTTKELGSEGRTAFSRLKKK